MNKKGNNRKSEVFGVVLKALGAGVVISAVFLFPGSGILLREFLKKEKSKHNPEYFRKMLKQIYNRKLVKIVQKNGEDFLEITKLGKKELLKYNFDDLKINKPKIWDGKWRMVIFDIPEKFREGRVALSRKLKEMNFYPLQKSVFLYPYECKSEIDFICELFDVKKFVLLLYLSTLDEYHDLLLKKHFDLL